ncbi:MAG: hypothetical protein M3323_08525 [Actinomycetota bacterium]|nr:hypothetical protein [Actinomycetota bacterium]
MDLRSRVGLVLVALAGLLAGHAASYFVVAPDTHDRAALLAMTGHSQHGPLGTLAVAAAFAGVIGIVMGCVRARCSVAGPGVSRVRVAALLWAVQTAGFVVLEAWERGHGAAGLLQEPAFLIGLVVQLVVALVATALVMLVRVTVDALLRLFAAPPSEASAPLLPATRRAAVPATSVGRAAWNLRGPPSPAGSPS